MVPDSELIDRSTPFADPDERIVGAFRAMRGPRPGSVAAALLVNVPVLAFSPTGIGTTLVIAAALAAVVLVLIALARTRVVCAVTDRGTVLLRCGRLPGRWIPQSLVTRGTWDRLGISPEQLAPRITIGNDTYWISGGDEAEVRRLARWIADRD